MQIFFTIRKNIPVWLTLLMVSAFFIWPSKAVAQRVDTVKTVPKTQKTGRILYGMASFYANKFDGRRTASGETFSQKKLTCACNVLPLGTWVKVTNLRNNHSVVVKTNDRIHPKVRRVVDLTRAAAEKLGFISGGLTRVKVEVIGRNPPH
jgi:rare lipoprotein A